MSTNSSTIASGRARSCTGCRQVKLACDARKTAPQPCSRCKNKGLQCKFDSNFKRIPMRRVAQEITNGIHQLLPATTPEAIAVAPTSPPNTNFALTVDLPATSSIPITSTISVPRTRIPTLSPAPSHTGTRRWLTVVENDYRVNYTLANVQLDAETVVSLFRHFERFLLPHAPFIVNIKSLSSLANESPLLFWTIVMTAIRDYENHESTYDQITVVHPILLSQISNIAIRSMEEIHALMILCLWAVPKFREKDDPSLNNIALATSAAMSLGCHNLMHKDSVAFVHRGFAGQAAADIDPDIAALTWIACHEIGTRLAAFRGVLPPATATIQSRYVSRAISSTSSIRTQVQKARTEILSLSGLSTIEVDHAEDFRIRFSLIQTFDGRFDAIAQAYESDWTPELDIELLAAKLYLYGLMFIVGSGPEEAHELQLNRQLILVRMRDASLKLISRMAQLGNTPVEQGFYPAGALTFYPKWYFGHLHMAVASLFRFMISYKGITQQLTATAISGLTEAHKVIQSFPDHRDAVRVGLHIQSLASIIRSADLSQPSYPVDELVVTNFLGASVANDAQFRSTHQRNRNPVTGASLPVSEWVLMNYRPQDNLPLAPDARAAASATSSNPGSVEHNDQSQTQQQSNTTWAGWDDYMSNFEISTDHWAVNDMLVQMDPIAQGQIFDPTSINPMSFSDLNLYQ